MHIGFVARADFAGDQGQVGAGDGDQVATGFQLGALLGNRVQLNKGDKQRGQIYFPDNQIK
jgi:hypothetical protein